MKCCDCGRRIWTWWQWSVRMYGRYGYVHLKCGGEE